MPYAEGSYTTSFIGHDHERIRSQEYKDQKRKIKADIDKTERYRRKEKNERTGYNVKINTQIIKIKFCWMEQ